MLFNPMMLAHSALVTQVKFYDVLILSLSHVTSQRTKAGDMIEP
jgi:hypothetical protein